MTDIAELGFRVNTGALLEAERRLDGVDRAGNRVEQTGARAGTTLDRSMRTGAGGIGVAGGAVAALRSNLALLSGAAIIGGIAGLTSQFRSISEEYQSINAALDIVTDSTEEFSIAQKGVDDIARESRTSLTDVASLYAAIGPSLEEAGRNQGEILKSIELTSKALKVGGGGAVENANALRQFSQALGSGVLRGDEFNSIMENGRGLAIQLAEGLGVPIGSLRDMAQAGELTAETVIDSLLKQDDAINELFDKLPVKSSEAWAVARNNVIQEIGVIDERLSFSANYADRILVFAQSIVGFGSTAVSAIDAVVSTWSEFRESLSDNDAQDSTFLSAVAGMIRDISTFLSPAIPYLDDFAIALAAVSASAGGLFLVSTGLAAVAAVVLSPIVLGISAVAAGAVLIRENWSGISAWWVGLWEGLDGDLGAFAVRFVESVGGMAASLIAEGVAMASDFKNSIVDGVSNLLDGIEWPSAADIAASTQNFVLTFGRAAADVVSSFVGTLTVGMGDSTSGIIWPSLGDILSSAASMIGSFISVAGTVVSALVTGISGGIRTLASEIEWPSSTQIAASASTLIAGFSQLASNAVSGFVGALSNGLDGSASDIQWPSLADILSSASHVISSFVSVAGTVSGALVRGISNGVSTLAQSIEWPTASEIGRGAANFVISFGGLALSAISALRGSMQSGMSTLADDIEWPTAGEMISSAFGFLAAMTEVAISAATAFVAQLVSVLGAGVINAFRDIEWPDKGDVLIGAARTIAAFGVIGLDIVSSIVSGFETLGSAVVNGIKSGLSGTSTAIAQALADVFDGIPVVGSAMARQMRGIGNNLGEGLALGMDDTKGQIEESSLKIAEIPSVVTRLRNLIQSPSRLMFGLGQFIGEGYALGITDKENDVRDAAIGISQQVVTAFDGIAETAEQSAIRLGNVMANGVIASFDTANISMGSATVSADAFGASFEDIGIAANDSVSAIEDSTRASDEQARISATVARNIQSVADEQYLLNIEITQGATAAREAELMLDGYSSAQAANQAATENNMNMQREFHGALVQSITNADSIKEAFGNMGDFLKDWLKEKIAFFAANQITAFLGLGSATGGGVAGIASEISNLFSGNSSPLAGIADLLGIGGSAAPVVGASGSVGGLGASSVAAGSSTAASSGIGVFASTAASFAGVAAAGFVVGEALGDLTGAANSTAVGIGTGLGAAIGSVVPVIGTFLGGAIGSVVGSAFGGDWEQVATATTINLSKLGQVTGTAVQEFEKERSFWRGTVSRSVDVEVGQDVTDQVQQYFDDVADGINEAARVLGSRSAGNILDGFSASFTSRSQEEFAEGLEASTIEAYQLATSRMGPNIRRFIGDNVDLMTAPLEEVEALFQNMTATVGTLLPAFDSLGISLGVNADAVAVNALNLSGAMGGLDNAMAGLSVLLDSEFLPATAQVNTALNNATANVDEWNESLGLADGAQIRTTQGIVEYIDAQDLGTAAGLSATIAAINLGESIQLVEAESVRAALTLGTVTDAANLLNLNFDASSPTIGQASDALVQLMGGLDNFSAATGNYYDKFFSDTERTQLELASSAAAVQVWTGTLSDTQVQLAGITDGTIDTNAEFRKYIESLDLTTQAGQLAFAQAIEIADSFDAVTASGSSMESIISDLPPELQNAFQSMVNDAQAASDGLAEESVRITNSINNVADSMEQASPIVNGLWTDQATQNLNEWWRAAQGGSLGLQVQSGRNSNGSFRTGLLSVPNDGFMAELHQGEMVATADVSSQLRAMGVTHNSIPDSFGATSATSIQLPSIASNDPSKYMQGGDKAELIAIRQELASLKSVMIAAAGDSTQQRREIKAALDVGTRAAMEHKDEARIDARRQLKASR